MHLVLRRGSFRWFRMAALTSYFCVEGELRTELKDALEKLEEYCSQARALADGMDPVSAMKGKILSNDPETGDHTRVLKFPPGMKHGPYRIPYGCMNFEIRYYRK